MKLNKVHKNSILFCGGAFGDEGKGRLVDELVRKYAKLGKVVVYRDNGGANAGHTVELENGKRIVLHQLPSGSLVEGVEVILGKGMVIHPADLVEEMNQIERLSGPLAEERMRIDEMAVLALNTHRAFEGVLKNWEDGGKGSTGKGISPAYADIILRHPLRARDLVNFAEEKIRKHYRLYSALVAGLGMKLDEIMVSIYCGKVMVGSEDDFVNELNFVANKLKNRIKNVYDEMKTNWQDPECSFVFEKAQGIGLDSRWGMYPDISASDAGAGGVLNSTEGIVNPEEIEYRAMVLKGTYMSSVGSRKLPTIMEEDLAARIRKEAFEYGATTGRSRDIAWVDLPALKFYRKVGGLNCAAQTHMDVVFPDVPIKICVAYEIDGKEVDYRPDQEYLSKVIPRYVEMPSWDKEKIQKAKSYGEIPQEAKNYLEFIGKELDLPLLMLTNGAKRDQIIWV